MGNKGQYSIILMDRESKNEEGSSYLDKKLNSLFNKDLGLITQWISIAEKRVSNCMHEADTGKMSDEVYE